MRPRGSRAWIAGAAALGLAAASCRGRPSPAECAAIADRYVDLAARETPGAAALTPAQLAAVRDVERGLKRAEPAFRRVQDQCQDITTAEGACALRAGTTKDWEACFRRGDR